MLFQTKVTDSPTASKAIVVPFANVVGVTVAVPPPSTICLMILICPEVDPSAKVTAAAPAAVVSSVIFRL